jgi:hypothetical protein
LHERLEKIELAANTYLDKVKAQENAAIQAGSALEKKLLEENSTSVSPLMRTVKSHGANLPHDNSEPTAEQMEQVKEYRG